MDAIYLLLIFLLIRSPQNCHITIFIAFLTYPEKITKASTGASHSLSILPQLESSGKFQLELPFSHDGSDSITVHSSSTSFCFISNKLRPCWFFRLCYKTFLIKLCLREARTCREAGKLCTGFTDSLLVLNQ